MRTTGLGLCSATHRLGTAASHFIAASAMKSSWAVFCWVFAGFYMCAFMATMMLPHDTRNRGLGSSYYDEVPRRAALGRAGPCT